MAEIPGLKSPPFYQNEWFVELAGSLPPVITLAITAYLTYSDPHKPPFIWRIAAGTAGWLAVVGMLKVRRGVVADRERRAKNSPEGLEGAVRVMYEVLMHHCGFGDDDKEQLRIAIHRVIPPSTRGADPETFEQVIPYVGGQDGQGRKFPYRPGIIGRAARENAPFAAK